MMHNMAPVSVWETLSRSRTLTDVEGAARRLLDRWPSGTPKPTSYPEALRACLGALSGSSSVEGARYALIKAADDAGSSIGLSRCSLPRRHDCLCSRQQLPIGGSTRLVRRAPQLGRHFEPADIVGQIGEFRCLVGNPRA